MKKGRGGQVKEERERKRESTGREDDEVDEEVRLTGDRTCKQDQYCKYWRF